MNLQPKWVLIVAIIAWLIAAAAMMFFDTDPTDMRYQQDIEAADEG